MLGAGSLAGCPNPTTPNTPEDTEGLGTTPFNFGSSSSSGNDPFPNDSLDTSGSPTDPLPELTTGGCAEVQVQVDPIIPTLFLLVDQSGSMNNNFSGQSRWDAMYETLMDPANGVVTTLASQVRFGLALYTSDGGFAGGECPLLDTVEPALDNFTAIDDVFDPADPLGDTPTGESLAAVAQMLADFQADGPKGIVLATDGEPDTCDEPNPQNGQPESLEAAAEAFNLGITTYIISVGDDVGADHLQEMANVGVGKAPDDAMPAPYYQALDVMQLVDAFEEIIGTFVSCELAIEGEVDLDQACDGTVTLDGTELECGVDYDLPDQSTLVLQGEACETLRDGGDHTVDASWPCGAVNIP
ncbi:MAG: vWA domain-containing protein [Myxococcota bacterium]